MHKPSPAGRQAAKTPTAPTRRLVSLLAVLLFAGCGSYFLTLSHAQTPAAASEAEQGQPAGGAAVIPDSSASGSQAVKFGTAASLPPLAFSKAAVWQTNDIRNQNAGNFDVNNANVIAATNRDAADMQAAGVTWARWWAGGASLSQMTTIATIFKNHGIAMDWIVIQGVTSSSADEAAMQAWLGNVVPAMAALGEHYWEIGNEPNIDYRANGYWQTCAAGVTPANTPNQADVPMAVGAYVTRLKDAYTTIHQYDSAAYVSSAGISYTPNYDNYCEIDSNRWFSEFSKPGYDAASYLDCVGIHPYAGSPAGVVSNLQATRSRLTGALSTKPFCVTEVGFWSTGYTSGSLNGQLSGDETTRAAAYTTLMDNLKAYGISTPVFWYTWYDFSQPAGFGIVHYGGYTDRTYLPIYTALKNYVP